MHIGGSESRWICLVLPLLNAMQIYLVLSENATSRFVPSTNLVYNFILLSVPTAATTWLILYNDSNAKYNFYVSELANSSIYIAFSKDICQ